MPEKHRCLWAESDPLLRTYHDEEWGVPQHDSRALWELLMLEGFQAGLAWITVLRKRDAFRKAFRQFDPAKVARFKEPDIARLLENPGNRGKGYSVRNGMLHASGDLLLFSDADLSAPIEEAPKLFSAIAASRPTRADSP